MTRRYLSLAVAAAIFVPAAAVAEPDFTKDEVASFLREQVELGATRGLCVGPISECRQPSAEAEEPKGYDLVVTFDFDSDVLTPQAKENLSVFAEALKEDEFASLTFTIEGHTDAVGDEDYNLDLSQRRADAVVRYLASLGVDVDRAVARGYGKSRPRTDDPYDPANRRVETRVVAR